MRTSVLGVERKVVSSVCGGVSKRESAYVCERWREEERGERREEDRG